MDATMFAQAMKEEKDAMVASTSLILEVLHRGTYPETQGSRSRRRPDQGAS